MDTMDTRDTFDTLDNAIPGIHPNRLLHPNEGKNAVFSCVEARFIALYRLSAAFRRGCRAKSRIEWRLGATFCGKYVVDALRLILQNHDYR
jgi:hypothetical protein